MNVNQIAQLIHLTTQAMLRGEIPPETSVELVIRLFSIAGDPDAQAAVQAACRDLRIREYEAPAAG